MLEIAIPILIVGLTILLAWPLGRYMRWAMDPVNPGPRRLAYEGLCQRLLGRFISEDQNWKRYVSSMLVFNLVMFVLVFVILTTQGVHPLNPDGKKAMEPSLAFNTSASFTSNSDLQHYSGEVSLSYFSQLFAMMWLQFVSAATGIAAGRGEVVVQVLDQGPGISPGQEKHIFEKFVRVGPSGANNRGAGLGLAICDAIIRAHGGSIEAFNRPEGGACLRFTLPIEGTPPSLEEVPFRKDEESRDRQDV